MRLCELVSLTYAAEHSRVKILLQLARWLGATWSKDILSLRQDYAKHSEEILRWYGVVKTSDGAIDV